MTRDVSNARAAPTLEGDAEGVGIRISVPASAGTQTCAAGVERTDLCVSGTAGTCICVARPGMVGNDVATTAESYVGVFAAAGRYCRLWCVRL